MFLCAIFGCGTRSGRDKGINMARIPSIITSRREEVRKFSTAGSVVNILSPEKRLNCGIVTIQICFRLPKSRSSEMWFFRKASSRSIKVSFHFLSGFKVNIADTRVFHLVCGTGKYQRALKLHTGKLSIDLCPGLKVK